MGTKIAARPVGRALHSPDLHADASRLREPAYVNRHLVATETLGPAALFYGSTSLTLEAATTTVVGPLETTDP